MRSLRGAALLVTAALVACAACATRVAETRPSSFTSLELDTPLSVLQVNQELPALCIDVNLFFETAVSDVETSTAYCAVQALEIKEGPDSAAACAGYFDYCRHVIAVDQRVNVSDCNWFTVPAQQCKATVGDLSACLFEKAANVHRVAQLIEQNPNFCESRPRVTDAIVPTTSSVCPTKGSCEEITRRIVSQFGSLGL